MHGGGESELGSSLTLTDSVGQRLEILLENRLGEGGQRHVVVYCPVWMVNTTHYRLSYVLGKRGLGPDSPSAAKTCPGTDSVMSNVFISGTLAAQPIAYALIRRRGSNCRAVRARALSRGANQERRVIGRIIVRSRGTNTLEKIRRPYGLQRA